MMRSPCQYKRFHVFGDRSRCVLMYVCPLLTMIAAFWFVCTPVRATALGREVSVPGPGRIICAQCVASHTAQESLLGFYPTSSGLSIMTEVDSECLLCHQSNDILSVCVMERCSQGHFLHMVQRWKQSPNAFMFEVCITWYWRVLWTRCERGTVKRWL